MTSINCQRLNLSLLAAVFLCLIQFRIVLAASTAVKTITVSAEAPAATSKEWSDDDTFQNAVLNSTNTYRKEHNATDVKWNDTLADIAQDWADKCEFKHSGGPTGENLATGYPNVTGSIEGWGNERKSYNFKSGGFSEKTGHFTQLVWRNTTSVGCGKKDCGSDPDKGEAWGWYLVCEYWPHGNVQDGYKDNVKSESNGSGRLSIWNGWIWSVAIVSTAFTLAI